MKEWFKARNIWRGAFEALSDAEAGRLAKALWHYTTTGEQVNLTGMEKGIYAMLIYTLQMDEAESNNLSEIRKKAGIAGAEAKQAKASKTKQTEANEAIADNKNKIKNKNKNIDIEITNVISPSTPKEADRLFDKFWSVYPRHEGKENARKAFAKLKPDDAMLETLINAILKQKQSDQWADPKYIPHPATWLNGHRWEDEPVKASKGGKRVLAQQYEQREYNEAEMREILGTDDLFK